MTGIRPIDELEHLRFRNQYLEDNNRWHRFALDLLVSMREAHDGNQQSRNPAFIFTNTRDYLRRLLDWRVMAFFTISEQDSSFLLHDCEPIGDWDLVRRESEQRIASGEFAWALNQNRHVILPAREPDRPLILHVLTTRNRIRGMFLGISGVALEALPESALRLLSVILGHTAHALESAELYRLLTEEKRVLQDHLNSRTAELEYRYTHDELTGLPNRVLLLDRLAQAVKHATRSGDRVAILVLDVDAFKLINDSLGRLSGDRLLKLLAERLLRHLRSSDSVGRVGCETGATLARLGGDEFCILLPEIQRVEDVVCVVDRLRFVVSEPFEIEGHSFYATCGVGVSLFPEDHANPEVLLSQAIAAMHHAKAEGRNRHQFYRPQINDRARHRVTMTAALRRALDRGEFELHYQPQIAAGGDRVIGCEALIRWRRGDGGLVAPGEFIPLLEEDHDLMIGVGDWVLMEAMAALRRLHDAGHDRLRMAINLSAVQFADDALAERVGRLLADSGLPPAVIELELTESTLTRDPEQAAAILRTLDALGLRIAVDDFGTGYSSLAYLKRFPLRTLKVDRSFVRDLPDNEEDVAIVRTILALARALNLEVVAEGVETPEQRDLLRRLECHLLQGFHYSRPLPESELLNYLAAWAIGPAVP